MFAETCLESLSLNLSFPLVHIKMIAATGMNPLLSGVFMVVTKTDFKILQSTNTSKSISVQVFIDKADSSSRFALDPSLDNPDDQHAKFVQQVDRSANNHIAIISTVGVMTAARATISGPRYAGLAKNEYEVSSNSRK